MPKAKNSAMPIVTVTRNSLFRQRKPGPFFHTLPSRNAPITILAMLRVIPIFLFLAPTSALATTWSEARLEGAIAEAKASSRWVLIDVGARWCGPCYEMDKKVWPRDEVSKAIEKDFVPLKRDGEVGEGIEIVKRFHVVGYPTVLLVDASGAEVDRLMGFVQPKDLLTTLSQMRAGKGTLAELEHKLAVHPDSETLRLDVGTRHAMRGDERALAELETVVKNDPDNKGKRAAAALLTLGKYYWLRGKKDWAQAEKVLRELDKRFPSSEEGGQVGYNLAVALHGQKRDAEARQVLDGWIAAAPKDVSRYSSYAWMAYKDGFDRARGIEMAKKGLEIDPKDSGLWDTLAELYAVTGKLADARAAEKQALAIKPDDVYYTAQLKRFSEEKKK
jgi:thioredoxin-like negative regulator of GroEL